MKHIKFVLILLITVVLLSACGKEKEAQDPLASVYINSAQTQIEKGNYDTAKTILEEALAVLGENEAISQMLLDVETHLAGEVPSVESSPSNEMQGTDSASNFDFSPYYGTWAEESIHWTGGGFVADIYMEKGTVLCDLLFVQGAPQSRIAAATVELSNAKLEDDVITVKFEDDGWGNTGMVSFAFKGEEVNVSISDIVNSGDSVPSWGFYGDTFYLICDDFAHDKLSYTMDMYYANQRLENTYNDIPSNESNYYQEPYFELGGIRYDDVSLSLPVSMDQLLEDLVIEEINRFYIGIGQEVAYTIDRVIPIKGEYTHKTRRDEYKVYLYGFFSYGDSIREAKFYLTYKYNDIGGWVLSGGGIKKSLEHSASSGFVPFQIQGKKLGNFSYFDYPSGSVLSLGEIADDILYAQLNYIKVYNQPQIFDITSLQIIKGNFWENEYKDNLDMVVRVGFTNDLYDASFDLELRYEYYAAGGWELYYDYIDEDYTAIQRCEDYTISPKAVNYSDTEFLASAKEYFNQCTQVSAVDKTDDSGNPVREITYRATRNRQYITEYYDVVLTATFRGRSWYETVSVALIDADYSKLIGTWEYRVGDEYIRLHIVDMQLTFHGLHLLYSDDTTATITYYYETSSWGTKSYRSETITKEIEVSPAYFYHKEFITTMYFHEAPVFFVSERRGAEGPRDVTIYICRDKGVYFPEVGNGDFIVGKEPSMEKIS